MRWKAYFFLMQLTMLVRKDVISTDLKRGRTLPTDRSRCCVPWGAVLGETSSIVPTRDFIIYIYIYIYIYILHTQ